MGLGWLGRGVEVPTRSWSKVDTSVCEEVTHPHETRTGTQPVGSCMGREPDEGRFTLCVRPHDPVASCVRHLETVSLVSLGTTPSRTPPRSFTPESRSPPSVVHAPPYFPETPPLASDV